MLTELLPAVGITADRVTTHTRSAAMDLNLEEKVAIVTGGGGAICGKIAGALALEKARVVIWDVNLAAAEKKAEDISLNGGNAAAVECDVLDKTSAVKALNSTIS
ncbi:hypothetical protein LCGC14_3047540, partial [marine sediment metagenome]